MRTSLADFTRTGVMNWGALLRNPSVVFKFWQVRRLSCTFGLLARTLVSSANCWKSWNKRVSFGASLLRRRLAISRRKSSTGGQVVFHLGNGEVRLVFAGCSNHWFFEAEFDTVYQTQLLFSPHHSRQLHAPALRTPVSRPPWIHD